MDREKDFVFSSNDIRCFVEDDEGSVWIGTFNGLNKIDRNGEVTCYRKDMTPGALKHSSIFHCIKIGRVPFGWEHIMEEFIIFIRK